MGWYLAAGQPWGDTGKVLTLDRRESRSGIQSNQEADDDYDVR